MAQQTVGVGTAANDGTGDAPRTAGQKINSNFDELYASIASLTSSVAGKANTSHTQAASTISDSTVPGRALLTAADVASQRTAIGIDKTLSISQVESPTTFPTSTEGTAGAITGTLYYLVSFITADGMTEVPRNIDGTTVLPTGITVTSKRVELTDIPVGPSGVTARQLWRGDNTGYNYRKLAVINDNTTTVYTDNEPFGLATDLEARWNSTGGYISVNGEARFIADPSFTAVGVGQSRTSNGENNSLFGYRAGASLEDGYWNSLFGSEAGESITSGYENSYFGYRAGKETTTGWYNAGFGMGALESVTTGGTNSACGRSAGGLLTTGGANCFMGYGSGQRMTTSTNSIVIGENSANFLNDGTTSFTDCDFGIYIGNGCRGYANDEQNAIVIGYLAKGLGTGTTVIGTLDTTAARIYGAAEFRSGVGNITAINVNGSDAAIGRVQFLAGSDGKGYFRVGTGGDTYDALACSATNAGLITFGAHVSFANGNWQMSNEGRHRISFDADGTTRIRGHGAGETHVFSNGNGDPILTMQTSKSVFSNMVGLKSYAVASVPSASTAGCLIYVSDETGGAVVSFSDGTNWRRVTDRAIVS